jgi:hypothetical protein
MEKGAATYISDNVRGQRLLRLRGSSRPMDQPGQPHLRMHIARPYLHCTTHSHRLQLNRPQPALLTLAGGFIPHRHLSAHWFHAWLPPDQRPRPSARPPQQGYTLLHHAAYDDKIELIEKLLAMGADIDAISNEVALPLIYAARRGTRVRA